MDPLNHKFEYFLERTEQDFAEIKSEIKMIHDKIDKLWNFRSLLVGAAMAASAIVSIVLNLVIK